MEKLEITAIYRDPVFSANSEGKDRRILSCVAGILRKEGHSVCEMTEQELEAGAGTCSIILSMCRGKVAAERLRLMEMNGATVINPVKGVRNCSRETMSRMLESNGIPQPDFISVDTQFKSADYEEKTSVWEGCWVKRGDTHSIGEKDVRFCADTVEIETALQGLSERGISRAVISRHVNGNLIKFYGVGDRWFHWFYPIKAGHSRFGKEMEGKGMEGCLTKEIPFDLKYLQSICIDASRALEVPVFGGDCIITERGEVKIIDFNDWPSFAPCCEEAARQIAGYCIDL